jgi:hypothetical protein
VAGHCEPDRIDIAAHHEGCRIPQCRKLCADGAGDVVYGGACQSARSMFGDPLRSRLLQRVVGEQPARRVIEFGYGPSAQEHSLYEGGRMIAEPPSDGSDIGNTGGIRQPVAVDIAQRLRSSLAAQIADDVKVEIYDGFTPVSMTL